jgi:two-component system LytT family response regulator
MRVLIVDDERRARNRLERLLRPLRGIEICAQSSDGVQALEAIDREKPDVVLLDVQMPGLDGFEVVNELKGRRLPLVIFVTAYDQYALKAFEVSATDYLLKPVLEERLWQALAKAENALRSDPAALGETAANQWRRLTAALATTHPAYLKHLVGRRGQKICILRISEIQAFLSEDELVFALLGQGRILVNRSLKELETQLDPDQFLRVHKQAIVNLSCIAEIESLASAGALAKLRGGQNISISRRYATSLKEKLGW